MAILVRSKELQDHLRNLCSDVRIYKMYYGIPENLRAMFFAPENILDSMRASANKYQELGGKIEPLSLGSVYYALEMLHSIWLESRS